MEGLKPEAVEQQKMTKGKFYRYNKRPTALKKMGDIKEEDTPLYRYYTLKTRKSQLEKRLQHLRVIPNNLASAYRRELKSVNYELGELTKWWEDSSRGRRLLQ